MSKTTTFGTGKREGHDASDYYNRQMATRKASKAAPAAPVVVGEWADKIYPHSCTQMTEIPDNSVALTFTSPPYNVGKDYDQDLSFADYLGLIREVSQEVYRVLIPGGRYVINIANLGRKPYIPLTRYFYEIAEDIGFLPTGEIIWQKGKGAAGNCAWGSWQSAKAPNLRDLHEYLLVFTKACYGRPDRGKSDIGRDEFMESTLSIWNIAPERASRIGHPAPFPVALAERVIRLYSYVGDVVVDPFMGSGTTAIAAAQNSRHYAGYEIDEGYLNLCQQRLAKLTQKETGPMKHKLKRDEILALPSSPEETFYIKLTRLYQPAPSLVYDGPAQLYIDCAPNKQVAIITPLSIEWAEYTPQDLDTNGDLIVEDYQMEIFWQK